MTFALVVVLASCADSTGATSELTPDAPEVPSADARPAGPPEDTCLDGQDMDGADVDLAACPPVPQSPQAAPMRGQSISLGAWELGTTATGVTYVYGQLSAPTTMPRILSYSGGSVAVNQENLDCWAKGYYRLRKMLQDPPAAYVALHEAGFQYRFFQFQTDLRNGTTGYKKISSFQDHLVKWVTVVETDGRCRQPTRAQFRDYSKAELARRGLPVPMEP
ncbi:MAG: hypothetical protein ACKV2T_20445 [Kofleriaceae bacterium]